VDGIVDEIRYSKTARTAGWLAYNLQHISNNTAFFSAKGAEEKGLAPVLNYKF